MNLFTVGVIVMCAAMILCWAYNFIRAGREKPQSILARRGLYICGMGAVALNLFPDFSDLYLFTDLHSAGKCGCLCMHSDRVYPFGERAGQRRYRGIKREGITCLLPIRAILPDLVRDRKQNGQRYFLIV